MLQGIRFPRVLGVTAPGCFNSYVVVLFYTLLRSFAFFCTHLLLPSFALISDPSRVGAVSVFGRAPFHGTARAGHEILYNTGGTHPSKLQGTAKILIPHFHENGNSEHLIVKIKGGLVGGVPTTPDLNMFA